MPPTRRCMCAWQKPATWPLDPGALELKIPWCEYLRRKIEENTDESDVWHGSCFRIDFSKNAAGEVSDQKLCFREAVVHHVPGNRGWEQESKILIARHHYPQAMLAYTNSKYLKYLNGQEILKVAHSDDQKGRLAEPCNQVERVLRKYGRDVQRRFEGHYFQAPASTKEEVQNVVRGYLSCGDSRQKERDDRKVSALITPQTRSAKKARMGPTLEERPTPELPFPTASIPCPESPQLALTMDESVPAESPEFAPSILECRRKIASKFRDLDGKREDLMQDRNFRQALGNLALVHHSFSGFMVTEKEYFYACSNPRGIANCDGYQVLNLCRTDTFCPACSKDRQNELRRDRKRSALLQCDTAPAVSQGGTIVLSRQPISTASRECLEKRLQHLQKQVQAQNKKFHAMEEKLKSNKDSMTFNLDESLGSFVGKALTRVGADPNKARVEIIKALLDLQLSGDIEGTDMERGMFAQTIVNEITNRAKKMNGHDKQVRFSPRLIRITMACMFRDPKAYTELQEAFPFVLPKPNYLQEIKSCFRQREGKDPHTYAQFKDEQLKGQAEDGHLLVDEIKLVSDMAMNSATNEIVGFVSSDNEGIALDLREELRSLSETATGDELEGEEEEAKPAVYANQWRFRSFTNKMHNSEFFFNTGNLTGDELLRQFMHVVNGYELCQVRVHGLGCDAGGQNAQLFKLLRHGIDPEGPWPSADVVSIRHFAVYDRTFFLWFCTTHGLKNLRNTLLRSHPKGSRLLTRWLHGAGINFGWKEIEELYERDEAQCKDGELSRQTLLSFEAVKKLDKWNIMNGALAKAPFQNKTLDAMFVHVANLVGCMDAIRKMPKQGLRNDGTTELSVGGGAEEWFMTLFSGLTDEMNVMFNDACQHLNKRLWKCMQDALWARKKSVQASYHYQVYNFLGASEEFVSLQERMPPGMKNKLGICVLCQFLSGYLLNTIIPKALSHVKAGLFSGGPEQADNQAEQRQALPNRSEEVNRFFGWAIQSVIELTKRQILSANTDAKADDLRAELAFVRGLRVFEKDILDNDEYVMKFYSPFMHVTNEGWLTLVKPALCDLALDLLNVVGHNVNDRSIAQHGNESGKNLEAKVAPHREAFRERFRQIESAGFTEVSDETKTKIFDILVEKTMRAKLGNAVRRCKSANFGRGGKNENSTAFRTSHFGALSTE